MAVSDCIRTCKTCGIEFRRTAKGQPTKYCSRACRKPCGKPRMVTTRRPRPARDRSLYPRHGRQATCAHCGCGFRSLSTSKTAGGWTRFCGAKCYQANRTSTAELVGRERNALARIAWNWRHRYSALVKREVAALKAIATWAPGRSKTVRPCISCGRKAIGTGELRRQCADCRQAMKRLEKARRRALERGAEADRIDPIAVFDRDGWRCHLCGGSTPRRLRGSHEPNAPELDHVVPLALGGRHTWSNVRCSCRRCNGIKGARALGQLALPIAA